MLGPTPVLPDETKLPAKPETFVVPSAASLNTARATRRVDIPLSRLVADDVGFDEVWTHVSLRSEAGALRSVELAPRSGRIFATPALPA